MHALFVFSLPAIEMSSNFAFILGHVAFLPHFLIRAVTGALKHRQGPFSNVSTFLLAAQTQDYVVCKFARKQEFSNLSCQEGESGFGVIKFSFSACYKDPNKLLESLAGHRTRNSPWNLPRLTQLICIQKCSNS